MRSVSVASRRVDDHRGGTVHVARLGLQHRAWRDGALVAASDRGMVASRRPSGIRRCEIVFGRCHAWSLGEDLIARPVPTQVESSLQPTARTSEVELGESSSSGSACGLHSHRRTRSAPARAAAARRGLLLCGRRAAGDRTGGIESRGVRAASPRVARIEQLCAGVSSGDMSELHHGEHSERFTADR